MRTSSFVSFSLIFSVFAFICVAPAFAQDSDVPGRLKIHVQPKQAYVFVDGTAVRDGSRTNELPEGDHTVGVYNYGYLPKIQKVHIGSGETSNLSVALQSSGAEVDGPFAELEFKGDPRAAVMLNGDTPAYFVGHVDEFNWNWIWHQRLLVKPGTYQVNVTRNSNKIWSGPVTAKAGQHVTIYLDRNGATKVQDWKKGLALPPQPRFRVGIASATIPIAPVTAQFSAQPANLDCGQSTILKWDASDAVDTSISNLGTVADEGQRTVTPKREMTYALVAKGPGGEATKTITVEVNPQPVAALTLSRPEVRFHKVGDKIVEQDSTTLDWSAPDATSVRIDPFGSEPDTGSRTLTPAPTQDHTGPVSEDVTYKLVAANACGGTTTKTAMVHIVGSIDSAPPVTLASVFYPTAYPTKHHPKVGLVTAEQTSLMDLATQFKNYEKFDNKASLTIVGHADVRGSRKYNLQLSRRRANLVKDFLIAQGISSDRIEILADGKDQELDAKMVESLQSKDTQKPPRWMSVHINGTTLAYNRRADVILEPKAVQSAESYPNDIPNARILWQRPEPKLKKVETAAKSPAGAQSIHASAMTD
ncbi:MAG TPA: OmpA family protein [Candidatus Acidoferrales bacterium]|nr:OmpA family protein [Candidatus Acidoferrales bacterium]